MKVAYNCAFVRATEASVNVDPVIAFGLAHVFALVNGYHNAIGYFLWQLVQTMGPHTHTNNFGGLDICH